jgi:hypothetical protein
VLGLQVLGRGLPGCYIESRNVLSLLESPTAGLAMIRRNRRKAVGTLLFAVAAMLLPVPLRAQTPAQPKVAPAPDEPDWVVVLRDQYGLSLFGDLANPVETKPEATAGLFVKAGPGPVSYAPAIALGLPSRSHGGWYRPSSGTGEPARSPLWSYAFKNSADDLKTNRNLPPPLDQGSKTAFDPGDQPFGLWVSNEGFDDGGVFTEPALVAKLNKRLAAQPYKAMIYPNRDKATGKVIPHSYLIGWEYSTNDDFQDIVCRVDNVVLIKRRQTGGQLQPAN